jgi:hypothetical protein
MDSQYFYVDDEVPGAQIAGTPDNHLMNFDTNPSICADANVVS